MKRRISTVLIIEDQEYIIRLIRKILHDTTWALDIDYSLDGIDSIKKLNEIKPDLVILDLYLPGKSGFEICQYIHGHTELKETRILAMSGDILDDTRLKISDFGATDFIKKPFTRKEFLEKLIRICPEVRG